MSSNVMMLSQNQPFIAAVRENVQTVINNLASIVARGPNAHNATANNVNIIANTLLQGMVNCQQNHMPYDRAPSICQKLARHSQMPKESIAEFAFYCGYTITWEESERAIRQIRPFRGVDENGDAIMTDYDEDGDILIADYSPTAMPSRRGSAPPINP